MKNSFIALIEKIESFSGSLLIFLTVTDWDLRLVIRKVCMGPLGNLLTRMFF